MATTLRSWTEADFDAVRPIPAHESLARDFAWLRDEGLESMHTDPFLDRRTRVLVERDGTPVGVGFAMVFGAHGGSRWSMMFGGVLGDHRRVGAGSRLLSELESRVRASAPWVPELCFGSWEPCPDVHAFAERHGYRPARRYWRMARALDATLEHPLPPGVTLRLFDGSDAAFADWAAIYNDSFSEHYHFFVTTPDDGRRIAKFSGFDPTGLVFAYRDGRCVGFCRNAIHPDRGELEIVGVAKDARGIGLGRALLRWGVRWLSEKNPKQLTLHVDGENERALTLYKDEGFEIVRTRVMFAKRVG
jgi:mycothiol synthase